MEEIFCKLYYYFLIYYIKFIQNTYASKSVGMVANASGWGNSTCPIQIEGCKSLGLSCEDIQDKND